MFEYTRAALPDVDVGKHPVELVDRAHVALLELLRPRHADQRVDTLGVLLALGRGDD